MPVSAEVAEALRWGDEEREELADEFLDVKVWTYVETLADLFIEHGTDITEDDIVLSDDILRALKREAIEHAVFVVDTYNSDLDRFLERNRVLDRDALLDTYDAWASDRADARSEMIAVTEAYSASADATLAFFEAQGVESNYDFGSHPDDDEPSCAVCVALVASNPHPAARAAAVGSPHPGCRQSWRRTGDDLPEELVMPTRTAGVVGAQPLVIRFGNDHDAAAQAVVSGALDG